MGYSLSFACMIIVWLTVMVAYISESNKVLVTINTFGEEYWDIGALIFATIFGIIGLYILLKLPKDLLKERK